MQSTQAILEHYFQFFSFAVSALYSQLQRTQFAIDLPPIISPDAVLDTKVRMQMIGRCLVVLLFLACCSPIAQAEKKEGDKSSDVIELLQKDIARYGRCGENVCFAIDGSSFVTSAQFSLQKNLVMNVTRVISADKKVRFAAVQYGAAAVAISRTTNNRAAFLQKIRGTKFKNSDFAFVGGAIVFCDRLLSTSIGTAGKMVLIGSGRNNLGGDPARRATNFRERGGELFAIGIGNVDSKTLKRLVGGDSSKLLIFDKKRTPGDNLRKIVTSLCSKDDSVDTESLQSTAEEMLEVEI